MKRIFNIALIAALLVSCDNFDNEGITPDNATSGDAIEFYAGDNTKTTYFEGAGLGIHWEEGDQVPIIARTKVDRSISNIGELRVRKYYTASSTGASTAFASEAGLEWSAAYTYKDTDNNTVTHGTIGQCDTDFFALHCGKQ